jgi:hypothetical protein
VLWLGMSITAILGYYCFIDFDGTQANYGTILQLTIYHMYIQGELTVIYFLKILFTLFLRHLSAVFEIEFETLSI